VAQYEVPDEVIPTSGRDVQCSDCGTTWFQHHPDHQPDPEEEDVAADWVEDAEADASDADAVETAEEVVEPDSKDKEAEETTPDVAPIVEAHAEKAGEFEEDYADEEVEDDAEEETRPANTPFPRQLDPSVAEVLREEAALEASARASEQHGELETQQELGLDGQDTAAQQRSEEARSRMARLRGDDVAEDVAEDIDIEAELDDQASRRNLLPDIDEINSSLGPESSADAAASSLDQVAPASAGKSGFRTGFRLAVILALIGLLLYIFAPQLAETVPALAEPLTQFREMVDGWRSGLDGIINNFASSLSEE